MDSFEISGSIDGTAATIRWEDGVFVKDGPHSDAAFKAARQVPFGLTATGPRIVSAAAPAEVALATALSCFDDLKVSLDGPGQDILAVLVEDLGGIPDGAVA